MQKLLMCLASFSLSAQVDVLNTIDPVSVRHGIHILHATAEVSVSDGTSYIANTVFIDPQRAVFQRVYSDRTITEAVDGKRTWQFDGEKEKELPDFYQSITLGHQFHALLLGLNRNQIWQASRLIQEDEKKRLGIEKGTVIPFQFDEVERWLVMQDRPVAMLFHPEDDLWISFHFSDWRSVHGMQLPYKIRIEDGQRTFTYQYKNISWNHGDLNDYRAPLEKQTPAQQIHRLHRQIMDDHLFERADTMFQVQAEQITMLSRGEVIQVEGKAAAERFEEMMKTRDHHIYDDLIRPIVHVSEDGTLAWAMVQVYAKGVYFGETEQELEFTSAWVELYHKQHGQWQMLGNVSNFKP